MRILGEVTPKRCEILRNADAIVVEEMKACGLYYKVWQSFAVLLPVRSVGVMGDERTYDYTIAIRAVESQDGMTADWVKLPYDLLEKLSSRIINEVKGEKELQGKTISFNFTQPIQVGQMMGIFQYITGLNFVMMPGVT